MKQPCLHCGKSLRRCKRIDVVDRELHFSCIEKLKKIKWEEDLELLRSYLKTKNIRLL
jgi:hypothetical protein